MATAKKAATTPKKKVPATKKAATPKKRTPAKRTPAKVATADTATKTEADVLAEVAAKEADMSGGAPTVLAGRVVTEHVDPDAERALKDPQVATDYNEAKSHLQELAALEKNRTEVLKAVAQKLMDLRAHFKQPGSKGRRTDWNGESVEYQALAKLAYQDAGVLGPEADTTKRSIRHHVEDVKRELVPAKDWEHFGIQALTRGQRQVLTAKSAKALEEVGASAEETGSAAATGKATGQQLVTLIKRIDAGLSVYSLASLRTLTPPQRQTFRQELEEAKTKTDQLLNELDGLD